MKIKVTSVSFSKNQRLRAELLKTFPDAVFNDEGKRYTPEELMAYLDGADGAIIGLEVVNRQILDALPQLRILSKYGVGLDNIDVAYAQSLGKTIGCTGGVNKRSVAEETVCFMLGLFRNLFFTGFDLKQGIWNKDGGRQLSGKTIGIVGCGYTGSEVIHLLQPFQCRILICDILDKQDVATRYGAQQLELSEILPQADLISLHVPLTPKTRFLINEEQLKHMRPSAFLINISRGTVVNQLALKTALINRVIAGAALDVFEEEPPTDLEFLALPNLMVAPHIGGNAQEAVEAMGLSAIQHLRVFFNKGTES